MMMPSQESAKIAVTNFGPVKEGEFSVKPLTFFIGPNNSGKSYMALLVYSLAQALVAGQNFGPFGLPLVSNQRVVYPELHEWLRSGTSKRRSKVEELPPELREALQQGVEDYIGKLREEVEVSLRDYFGYENMNELLQAGNGTHPLSVRVGHAYTDDPILSIDLKGKDVECAVKVRTPEFQLSRIKLAELRRSGLLSLSWNDAFSDVLAYYTVQQNWVEFLREQGFAYTSAYYLPSARSGILQGWQLFASMAVQVVRRRIGFERIEVPRLQGVAGDFLQILWDRLLAAQGRTRENNKMQAALDLLEDSVFRGQISFSETRPEQPLMVYKSGSVQVPLQRASSMVAELAPLDLWMKYLLAPGDLLIIDEPEAHLHPENQRRIAQVLVRLVRAGVHIICPTHSSLILHQVSNLMLASRLSAEEREARQLGLTEDDLISSDEIGVYLFEPMEDGTHIRTVEVDPEYGISEDEFVRVAEAIGEETYRLSDEVEIVESKG